MSSEFDNHNDKDLTLEDAEREVFHIMDEAYREMLNTLYITIENVTHKEIELGFKQEEEARVELEELKTNLFENYPKALGIIFKQEDEGGWLANWLPDNQDFIDIFMEGQWPDWLPKRSPE